MSGTATIKRTSTMRNKKPFRIFAVLVIAVLLLVPGLLMTLAWGGTLNLEVAVAAIAVTIAVAIWLPKVRWLVAGIAALLIAVPPFPYWTNWDETRGQYLHFFHGFTLNGELITRFAVVFAVAMLLFATMFWAINGGKAVAAR